MNETMKSSSNLRASNHHELFIEMKNNIEKYRKEKKPLFQNSIRSLNLKKNIYSALDNLLGQLELLQNEKLQIDKTHQVYNWYKNHWTFLNHDRKSEPIVQERMDLKKLSNGLDYDRAMNKPCILTSLKKNHDVINGKRTNKKYIKEENVLDLKCKSSTIPLFLSHSKKINFMKNSNSFLLKKINGQQFNKDCNLFKEKESENTNEKFENNIKYTQKSNPITYIKNNEIHEEKQQIEKHKNVEFPIIELVQNKNDLDKKIVEEIIAADNERKFRKFKLLKSKSENKIDVVSFANYLQNEKHLNSKNCSSDLNCLFNLKKTNKIYRNSQKLKENDFTEADNKTNILTKNLEITNKNTCDFKKCNPDSNNMLMQKRGLSNLSELDLLRLMVDLRESNIILSSKTLKGAFLAPNESNYPKSFLPTQGFGLLSNPYDKK